MTTPLANLITKIGFDIDTKSIAALDASLARLESRLKGLSSSLQGLSDNKTLNAAARLANAQARKMNAEIGLQRQNAAIAKVQADTEKLRQKSVLDERSLLKKRIETESFVAKAKATADKFRASTANKEAAAVLKSTPYAPRPAREPRSSGAMGSGYYPNNLSTYVQAIAAGGFAQQAYTVANFSMGRMPQYEFLTGSAEEAKKQIAFVDKEVNRLSLDLVAANSQYKQMLAAGSTSIGLEKTQELFTNFSNLSTMLGLGTDAQKRGVNALSQMMSKGQVMAEELKGQLAEALPNAVGIFADALYGNGKAGSGDKAKLFADMEKGKVGLKELTKVIEYMGTLTRQDLIDEMLKTPEKKLAKLKTQWILTLEKLNDAGFLDMMIVALDKVTNLLVDLTVWVNKNKTEIKEWADRIIGIFGFLIDNLPLIIGYWASFKLAEWMAVATASTVPLAAALRTLLLRFLVMPALIAAAGLALVELSDTLNGKNTILWNLAIDKNKGILGYISALTISALDFAKVMASVPVLSAMQLWGYLTGNDVLVDSAKRSYTDILNQNDARQAEMFKGTALEGMSSWGGFLGAGNTPLTQQSLRASSARVNDPRFGAGSAQDIPVAPQINITTTTNKPEEMAQLVSFALEDFYSKKMTSAASNWRPTPLTTK